MFRANGGSCHRWTIWDDANRASVHLMLGLTIGIFVIIGVLAYADYYERKVYKKAEKMMDDDETDFPPGW